MKEKIQKFISDKKWIVLICLIFLVAIFIIYFFNNKNNYKVFLEVNMPKDSYGKVIYSPGNQHEFNLYKNSYLNYEYTFSDKNNRDIDVIIENKNVIDIENGKIIAKEIGQSKIYIKTKDDIKSNIIIVNVISENE